MTQTHAEARQQQPQPKAAEYLDVVVLDSGTVVATPTRKAQEGNDFAADLSPMLYSLSGRHIAVDCTHVTFPGDVFMGVLYRLAQHDPTGQIDLFNASDLATARIAAHPMRAALNVVKGLHPELEDPSVNLAGTGALRAQLDAELGLRRAPKLDAVNAPSSGSLSARPAPEPTGPLLTAEDLGERAVVRISRERVDSEVHAGELRESLSALAGKKVIVVNLENVKFLDDGVIGVLVRSAATAKATGCEVRLAGASKDVWASFTAKKFNKMITNFPNEAAALAA